LLNISLKIKYASPEAVFSEEKSANNFINFPISSDYNSVYPPNVYQSLDQHGSFEVNEPKFNYKIYPCS